MAMKIYLCVVLFVASVVFVFGFLAPYMISSASTELVWGGFAIIVIYIAALLKIGPKLFNYLTKKGK